MTSKTRRFIIAEHLSGKSYAAIARELGITPQAISNDRSRYPRLWSSDVVSAVLVSEINRCKREINKHHRHQRATERKIYHGPEYKEGYISAVRKERAAVQRLGVLLERREKCVQLMLGA